MWRMRTHSHFTTSTTTPSSSSRNSSSGRVPCKRIHRFTCRVTPPPPPSPPAAAALQQLLHATSSPVKVASHSSSTALNDVGSLGNCEHASSIREYDNNPRSESCGQDDGRSSSNSSGKSCSSSSSVVMDQCSGVGSLGEGCASTYRSSSSSSSGCGNVGPCNGDQKDSHFHAHLSTRDASSSSSSNRGVMVWSSSSSSSSCGLSSEAWQGSRRGVLQKTASLCLGEGGAMYVPLQECSCSNAL